MEKPDIHLKLSRSEWLLVEACLYALQEQIGRKKAFILEPVRKEDEYSERDKRYRIRIRDLYFKLGEQAFVSSGFYVEEDGTLQELSQMLADINFAFWRKGAKDKKRG